MSDPLDQFLPFCSDLRIVAKDKGEIPLVLNGPQREFVRRIRKAWGQGIHWVVCLKGRQEGITTVSLALDLYWPAKFDNIQGGLISETEDNREFFRSTLTQYYETLPPEWRFPIKRHNRSQLIYGNGSRLSYVVAGTRLKARGGTLGQGKAFNYAHFTEVSSYGDPADFERALGATLSETFPHRLYLFESTARGFNHFYDLWQTAKKSRNQVAVFLPWWLKENYRAEGRILQVYGGFEPDSDERRWINEVERIYGYKVDRAQLAWWRWKLNEQYEGNLSLMLQEYPPTETDAFQATGSAFFSAERLTDAIRRIKDEQEAGVVSAKGYRYSFGTDPMDVMLSEAPSSAAHLRIYKEPVQGAVYVLGADPAYGASEWADQFCVQVLRCWGDKVEQVAEFCSPAMNTVTFAWVLCHIAGYYNARTINLEITGPGQAVLNELNNIIRRREEFSRYMTGRGQETFQRVLGQIGYYLYRREDSVSGGFFLHTKTNADVKARMMNALKDTFELKGMIVNSPSALREMRTVISDRGSIEAHGRAKDDRVIALALAVVAWKDMVQTALRKRRVFYQPDAVEQQQRLEAQAKEAASKGPQAPRPSVPIMQFLHPSLRRELEKAQRRAAP
jgi:hypothetical protein